MSAQTSASDQQQEAEVVAIYERLVKVEAECISANATHAANPQACIRAEEWLSLVALQRTLLYEQHDFLMVTQHPSATDSLRALADRYNVPARIWKHGIHTFLENLRHRMPGSQDFMFAFVNLAYGVMVSLLEEVHSFADVWMECLGDLARSRMAVAENEETRSMWISTATSWYTKVSDRGPTIGRLYHHLGLLERPNLRKFCYYSKALTCIVAFSNTCCSLSTLCAPILQNEEIIQRSRGALEARTLIYHAMVLARYDITTTTQIGQDSLQLLSKQLAKLRDIGPFLAAINMAALLQQEVQSNPLWQVYTAAINQTVPKVRVSEAADVHTSADPLANIFPDTSIDPFLYSAQIYFFESFNTVALHCNTPELLKDCLSFMHVKLVCLHSFHTLTTRLGHGNRHISDLFHYGDLDFSALARFLNALARHDFVSAHILDCARYDVFPTAERKEDDRPLSEDYIIRGHIWGQFYFPSGWFECQDDTREIETSSMMEARVKRVLWLGLFLAFHTEQLHFDIGTHVFSATTEPSISATMADFAHLAITGPHSPS